MEQKTSMELNLLEDFKEYEKLIKRINKNSRRLVEINDEYIPKSEEIIAKAMKDNFDFKGKYGANTKEVRQRWADEQLKDLADEKQELTFQKNEDERQIAYLKRLIDMKINLIKYSKE